MNSRVATIIFYSSTKPCIPKTKIGPSGVRTLPEEIAAEWSVNNFCYLQYNPNEPSHTRCKTTYTHSDSWNTNRHFLQHIPGRVIVVFQKNRSNMCGLRFQLISMREWVKGQMCADPGATTPIKQWKSSSLSDSGVEYFDKLVKLKLA